MIVVVVSGIIYSVELYVKRRVQSSSAHATAGAQRFFLLVDHDAFGPVGQQHTLSRLHNFTTCKQTLVCDTCMN